MEKEILANLAKRLNLTNHEEGPEEYILTEEEEKMAIDHEIKTLKSHKEWKLRDLKLNINAIDAKLSMSIWEDLIDREEILKRANSNKQYAIWQLQQRLKENKESIDRMFQIEKTVTAKFIFNLMVWKSEIEFNKKLIVDENTIPLIKTLCFFISKDERFESELGFSFKKGLLIRGVSGLGKTHLVECIKDNDLQPILVVSMISIAQNIKDEGGYNLPNTGKIIYLDDVGTEENIINHYGTKINWFKDFVETYYQKMKTYNKLIISTNNSFLEIEEKYGSRVRSRTKDMFNIINVTGKDLRG